VTPGLPATQKVRARGSYRSTKTQLTVISKPSARPTGNQR
jgi:hypothetical protein